MIRDLDDLLTAPGRRLADVLPTVNPSTIAMALVTATPELRDRVLGFLHASLRRDILDEIDFLGPVPLAHVEAAQFELVSRFDPGPRSPFPSD